jgi:hypothetical protein
MLNSRPGLPPRARRSRRRPALLRRLLIRVGIAVRADHLPEERGGVKSAAPDCMDGRGGRRAGRPAAHWQAPAVESGPSRAECVKFWRFHQRFPGQAYVAAVCNTVGTPLPPVGASVDRRFRCLVVGSSSCHAQMPSGGGSVTMSRCCGDHAGLPARGSCRMSAGRRLV